jgi:hypothetical protein
MVSTDKQSSATDIQLIVKVKQNRVIVETFWLW